MQRWNIWLTATAVSNRMPEHFPDPDHYEPGRYGLERREDQQLFAWIPFGAGRHRCVGNAFAMMQLKAIFSDLLRRYDFELAQPHASYKNDHSKLVVQMQQPCRVRYRRRKPMAVSASMTAGPAVETTSEGAVRLRVDLDLCQGHGVCANEAPEVFAVDRESNQVVFLAERPDQQQRANVDLAVQNCPTRALTLETR